MAWRVLIITVSDKGSRGERADTSGPLAEEIMIRAGYESAGLEILPDEKELLKDRLRAVCDQNLADLILTSGGTGLSQRDVTPEATIEVSEKLVPGLPEAMRAASLKITSRAMLSRAAAGVRGRTLIINLPGSPKGVRENLEVILPALDHGLGILTGQESDCAQPERPGKPG
ncbi:MAG: MogA/MoaB family molybdenum cofactor biosynthesis protein [Deltaproteobacteria bacterium]|nr:MogA/MoaB family molybdenum cofactor biosynthesis protein [Deltaproteobacteria bacterium]